MRKGESSKKIMRISPTNKRKTPSKMPKKEINFEMDRILNQIEDREKSKESPDELATYKQESLTKLTGTIFSSSIEKSGSFT